VSRFEAWLLHLSTLAVGGTGLVYAWMLYLLRPIDPYAVIHHPLQPAVQHLHVLTAPALVFAAGLVWRRHVAAQLRAGAARRRPSGVGLVASLAPMVVSGYLIQVAVDAGWRRAWVLVHLIAAGLWLAAYLVHVLRRAAAAAAAERAVGASRRVAEG
jgi:hypothetical protein